jgi:hypothetical protein
MGRVLISCSLLIFQVIAMKTSPAATPKPGSLEQIAGERLAAARGGDGRVFISEPSLSALLRLAADASHAPDALVLLQELQVQQIELDMQLDELRRFAASAAG